ncbi:TetR/AcrR family transcriptional regulator [Corynebacterium sp.]|uniref:TetR/AcrR family transcriptional regulator n=1 Tax=Corynebacterium sp. TaxID=1720 RepID=UPI0026DF2E28|nr:TetR/AcrR family transcriptional regulator [Corynebacterium sp.]MDO5512033.1 TetR/AcrR family transcriptional regulator [Corynebacterium sp.]
MPHYDAVEFTQAAPRHSGPGRPREESYNDLILDTVHRLISEGTPVTIRGVVKASGVSRTAIYRRWSSVHELVAASLDRGRANLTYTFHGPIRLALKDIFYRRVNEAIGPDYTDRDFRKHVELMMGNRQLQQAYWDNFASRRLDRVVDALRLARKYGEIDASDEDIEAATDALYGIGLFQMTVRGISFDDPEALRRGEQFFDILWRGLGGKAE